MHRTPISIKKSSVRLAHQDQVFTIGSCFSDMIAAKLLHYKWSVVSNPFGTLFDPVSISENVVRSLSGQMPSPDLYDVRDDVHLHYQVHSDLCTLNRHDLERKIQEAQIRTLQSLKSYRWVIITLGSMIVFEHKRTGAIVANCHKMPQDYFIKRQLTFTEAQQALHTMIAEVRSLNPEIKFIFTVSPVRHVRHGLAENMLSKSSLRVLCEDICHNFDGSFYFPSYEIMLDDLRDYQYYKADGIHPSSIAENYIWEKFAGAYMAENLLQWIDDWDKLMRAVAHRPHLPDSKAHQNFLKETIAQLEGFSDQIDVSEEMEKLKKQLR